MTAEARTDPEPVSAVVAIIPARFASTRFPGKVLADRTGKPLIQHVHEQVARCRAIDRIIVAADDQRVCDAVRSFCGEAVMTRAHHPNGSSRLAEVAESLPPGADLIVNVQADEPEIEPRVIELAIDALKREAGAVVSTIASPFAPGEDASNPNIVKVVLDQRGRALYFSRALIPFDRDGRFHDRLHTDSLHVHPDGPFDMKQPLKHVGLYVYRREFLLRYVALPATPMEQVEQLEQLRMLEHGFSIVAAVTNVTTCGIDTPEQYEAFVRRQRDHSAAR